MAPTYNVTPIILIKRECHKLTFSFVFVSNFDYFCKTYSLLIVFNTIDKETYNNTIIRLNTVFP
ncbi:hypothetical protein SAMN05421786_104242 [Chryseobacterium ureilyticum]|uniref:Uncharacterized protein n=1 Tax=Chryseobacterium ureilyticum TaxID=373668 RepID=A0A1N7P0C0_9FLAO|nr:hypothetical protein SAMN05421786_104242 [Chryseobacterium ureilyticum]